MTDHVKDRNKPTKRTKPAEKPDVLRARNSKPTGKASKSAPDIPQFPIIGIGASAGGLSAFEEFFSGMPVDSDPGMAFVLVQHLAPDHKSILTELIRRYTRMQVFEVEDGMAVQPNCAYIIPPNHDMALINGSLQLLEPSAPRGQRLPIDFFFRSLAHDQRDRAIGIVLSGTGSDGSMGVRAIKGEGGIVFAQTPETTEFNGMPRNAIATGLVDFILSPPEMPKKLIAYMKSMDSGAAKMHVSSHTIFEHALSKVFVLLRAQTGHDFSNYKPSTILRRIERRMAVHQIENADAYVKYLQQSSVEIDALFQDMLIGVTSFFRDPAAFKTMEEKVIPKLFAGKSEDGLIRVWLPGCSTGEEAYSLAILLSEYQELIKKHYRIQVFATDIDTRSIATARAGIYPLSIAADVSAERLARFFTVETGNGGYRIHKSLREMLVFSEQNLIKNPPFSKLDLISCRNLMIYLDAKLQKKLIPLFHYALNAGGYLFLGTSETIGEFNDLFVVTDRKARLYQRKPDVLGSRQNDISRVLPSIAMLDANPPHHRVAQQAPLQKHSYQEITEQALLEHILVAAVLVDGKGDIKYIHGRTGVYLEPPPGEQGVSNVLKMAREGLRRELTTALHKSSVSMIPSSGSGLQVNLNGSITELNFCINPIKPHPLTSDQVQLFLIVFEPAYPAPETAKKPLRKKVSAESSEISALKQELQAKEEYLLTANEELETANEELKSANEELQSVNEEMQSTNEELETSKEELQSVNEELTTVNSELQTKLHDLTHANNDMNNLLAGTNIATIFVDQHLRILRFTPSASRIINLITSDMGRSVGHIVSNMIGYSNLIEDTQAVLDTRVSKEIEVMTTDQLWFTLRIQPYRTLENVIEGAVITFIDITEIVKTREALRKANELLNKAGNRALEERAKQEQSNQKQNGVL
jgi:two-component system CheB/CheR fusion protein